MRARACWKLKRRLSNFLPAPPRLRTVSRRWIDMIGRSTEVFTKSFQRSRSRSLNSRAKISRYSRLMFPRYVTAAVR
jgi:hypothetical protein